MLVLYIRNLDEESLAFRVLNEQKEEQWPGLAKETENICKELNIENVHETKHKTKKYRKIVVEACHKANEQLLKKLAEGKNKCERMKGEEYGKKEYVKNNPIYHVRQIYRSKYGRRSFDLW